MFYEMTQGDPFYAEVAFQDQYGLAVPLSQWGISVDFKLLFSDAYPTFSLTRANGGIITITSNVIALFIQASDLATVDINPTAKNGDIVPSRQIFGDLKLTPPSAIEFVQGSGARTPLVIKLYMGVTA